MAKLTLLQIVQRVLSATDGDDVTSIDETVESEQVVELVKTVYDDIMSDFPWYHRRETVQLEVTATPNQMRIPNEVDQLLSEVIYYNKKEVRWVIPENMQNRLRKMDTTLDNIDDNGAVNDADPAYWSSMDDENIVFNAYDGSLVSANTEVWAAVTPSTPQENTDIPDMPHNLHGALLYGVLGQAFTVMKGDPTTGAGYERKMIKKIAKAKRFARRTGQERNPGQDIDYGRRNISRSNEISSSSVIEGNP